MHESTTLRQSGHVIAAPLGDEVAMMDPETGTYFVLDPVGSRIWNALVDPTSLAALLTAMGELHDVSGETLRSELVPFVEKLVARGLLVTEG